MRKMINRKGSTLALTIIIFAVLMIFATFTLGFMVTENKQAMYHQNKVKAYYSARSGAEIAEAAIIDYIDGFVAARQWSEIDNFITSINGTAKLDIISGGIVVGLEDVVVSVEKLINADASERDVIRIDSTASIGGVSQSAAKLLYFEAVRTNLDVSKKGGAPIIVTGGAWVENTNGSDDLTMINDEYNLTFAEKISPDSTLYPDYAFPPQEENMVKTYDWSVPAEVNEEDIQDLNMTENFIVSNNSYYNNLTVSNMIIEEGVTLNIKGNLTINGDVVISRNAGINVNGSVTMNNGAVINMGDNSEMIVNDHVYTNYSTGLNFYEDEQIHIGKNLEIGQNSTLTLNGDSTLIIGSNYLVDGALINFGASKVFVHGYMRINDYPVGFNETQINKPETMELYVYNYKDGLMVDDHALIINKTDGNEKSIVGNFFINKGKVRVSLKQTYFYGNIVSNEVYIGEGTQDNLSTYQDDYTVNIVTSNSNYAVYFKGSVYAKYGYVLLGGGTDASDKGALGQTGIIVSKFVLVEGNNEEHNYRYMLDLYDNLQSNTITIPVDTNNMSAIQSLIYISNYID